ncbi:MAG: hypothetical protein WC924_01230 [Candidatus Gracilibacteria bacterium]
MLAAAASETPVQPIQERILGSRLAECLTLLFSELEFYEEWAGNEDFTLIELLQCLEANGVFTGLQLIEELGKAVQERLQQIMAKISKTHEGSPERLQARANRQLEEALRPLFDSNRPLRNEIINQTFEAGRAALLLSAAKGMIEERAVVSPFDFSIDAEWELKRKMTIERQPSHMHNFCNLMLFLATCKGTSLNETAPLVGDETKAANAFEKYRWAEVELVRPGIAPTFRPKDSAAQAMGLAVVLSPPPSEGKAPFEAFRARVEFKLDVPNPATPGLFATVLVEFLIGLSRIHSGITLSGNGYVSLEPFFEAYGLSGLYKDLAAQLWRWVKAGIEPSSAEQVQYFRIIEKPVTPAAEVEEVVEVVVEEAQENVAEALGISKVEKKPRATKKGRRTTRNIAMDDVLGVLKGMGIAEERQSGGSHLVLRGRNLKTETMETLAIPVSSNGGSAPYVAQAARVFGFTRPEFLKALDEL